MAAELPNFKKFVSEDDIAAAKKTRQDEWEKVRQPHQPEEAPEEAYDPRSLFERLEANRVKKQEEFDESHRMKNMVKGLENDEIEFLERVSQQKEQEEEEKALEERMLLAEYKLSLVRDRTIEQEQEIESAVKKPANKPLPQKHVSSQRKLLAGIIRKKSTDSEEPEAKKSKAHRVEGLIGSKLDKAPAVDVKLDTAPAVDVKLDKAPAVDVKLDTAPAANVKLDNAPAANVKLATPGLLPGIGDYSDSESGESD